MELISEILFNTENTATEKSNRREIKAEEITLNETKEVLTEEVLTEEVLTEEVLTKEVLTEEVETEEVLTKEVETEEVLTEEVETKEVLTEEVLTKEVETEEVLTEEVKSKKVLIDKKSEILIQHSFKKLIVNISKLKDRSLKAVLTKYKENLSIVPKISEEGITISLDNKIMSLYSVAELGATYIVHSVHSVKG